MLLLRMFVVSILAAKFSFFVKPDGTGKKQIRFPLALLRRPTNGLEDPSPFMKKEVAAMVLKQEKKLSHTEALEESFFEVGPLMRPPPEKNIPFDYYYSVICHDPGACGIDVDAFPGVDLRAPKKDGHEPVVGIRIYLKEVGRKEVGVQSYEFFPARGTEQQISDFLENDDSTARKNRR